MHTKKKSLFYFLCILTLSSHLSAFAGDQFLLIGGGGEPQGSTTIFDEGLKDLAPNLNNSKWQYEVSFNGGHSTTENILKSFSKSPNKPFTKKMFQDLIDSYKKKILFEEIKKGDQLIIAIYTHGAINNGTKDLTHDISVSGGEIKNFNTLEGSETVNLDALKDLVKFAEAKGVKLGIVDLSCHSGSTLELKKSLGINTPNTCIISASGPKHFGFVGTNAFANLFFQNLKKGKNLEQVFLESRLASTDPGLPMISTEESLSIYRDIYSGIYPYLYYHDEESAKLTEHLDEIYQNELLMCLKENQFKDLISQINRLDSTVSNINFNRLKSLLGQYKNMQDKIFQNLKALDGNLLKTKIEMITPVKNSNPPKPIKQSYTLKEMLNDNENESSNFEKLRDIFAKKAIASPVEREYHLALAKHYEKLRDKSKELLAKYPRLKNYEQEKKNLFKNINSTRNLVKEIALEEKKLYDSLYKKAQGLNFNDPCRKIVF